MPLAQLVEHKTFNLGVVGSSPTRHSLHNRRLITPIIFIQLNNRRYLAPRKRFARGEFSIITRVTHFCQAFLIWQNEQRSPAIFVQHSLL